MGNCHRHIGSTHLLFFNFRSVPLQFDSIEQERNGNGTELEQEWSRNGTELEREWSGNGAGTELEWNWNEVGMERIGNGTEMEQKFNGRTMNAQFRVPGLLYDCIQAGSP